VGSGVIAWGKAWGNAWGKSWGAPVEFPQYVAPGWPKWEITEQTVRATGGLLHLTLDRRRAVRRGG